MTPDAVAERSRLGTLVGVVLGDRVQRNAGALALNAVVSSVLGLGYWWLAARRYDADLVGINAAMIATMTLVAGASDIGLKNGLVRFAGVAGRATMRLIGGAYLTSALISAVVGLFVVWVVPSAVGDPDGLRPVTAALFVLGAVTWSVFVLQDSVLTGFGRSSWVLAENTVYGVLKFVALVALSAGSFRLGIFFSWTIPVALMVVVVNLGLVRRLPHSDEPSSVGLRELSRYAGSDFVASTLWKAATRGMPLFVLVLLSEADAAYYHVAWSIAYVLYLLVSSVSEAIVADGASGPPDPSRLRRALALDVGLVAPAALVTVLAAPVVMAVFGAEYADQGTTGLRLLALSAIPYAVSGSILAVCRIEQRLATIIGAYACIAVVLAVGSWALGRSHGVAGIGGAWLLAQTVTAVFLLTRRPELLSPLLRAAPVHHVQRHRLRRRARPDADVIRRVEDVAGVGTDDILWITQTDGVIVAAVDGIEPEPTVIRIPTTDAGRAAIEVNRATVTVMVDDEALGEWRALLPRTKGSAEESTHGAAFGETLIPGRTGSALMEAGRSSDVLVGLALDAIAPLHARTAEQRVVDDDLFSHLVTAPLDRVAAGRPDAWSRDLAAVSEHLHDSLHGVELATSRIHGDYWLANILFTEDPIAVSGIIDWERSITGGLPEVDSLTLALTATAAETRREFGVVVATHLRDGTLPPIPRVNAGVDDRALLLLVWANHVGGNLLRTPHTADRALWAGPNIDRVLATARTALAT